MENEKQAFYKQDWFTIVMLVMFAPVGMFLMWRYRKFNKMVRAIVTTFFAVTLSISLLMGILFGVTIIKAINTPGGEGGFYVNKVSDTEETVIEDEEIVQEEVETADEFTEEPAEESGETIVTEESADEKELETATDTKVMGDTMALSNSNVTLNAVRKDTEGGMFGIDNDFYLIVDLTVENTSNEEQTIESVMNVLLEDAEGNLSVASSTYQDTKGSVTGIIAPGETLQGELAYDVKESASYKLVYTDLFGDGEVVWIFDGK